MDLRKPDWLRAKLPTSAGYKATREIVDTHDLHTVCKSAQCPNMGECWSRGTATVMILGNICTRDCQFCSIAFGKPEETYVEVLERIQIFNENGGMVFNSIHNIQANTPTENVLAMFRAIKDSAS